MVSIAECLKRSDELSERSDSARLDVELLLCHSLGRPRSYLYTWPERQLTPVEESCFSRLLAERKQGRPIAHLLGEKEFWSLSLQVNDSTLIPRPETELLVEAALAIGSPESARVLDLGTGTGAIALALATERPGWQLVAVDKSLAATELALRNCRRLLCTNVKVLQSDWFSSLEQQCFDLIVANPPYIDPNDFHLEQGDLRFEPRSALVASDCGLADIRHIVNTAPQYLSIGGWLLLEHGYQQGPKVRELFAAAGFQELESRLDLGGRERITLGRRKANE